NNGKGDLAEIMIIGSPNLGQNPILRKLQRSLLRIDPLKEKMSPAITAASQDILACTVDSKGESLSFILNLRLKTRSIIFSFKLLMKRNL
ncbi:hypothetical protein, partial [Pseudomonas syringae]|uniref:hypothetical protein n=1 Tax=Pseudomonas syringae TaxID=317 RepID=UPI0034D6A99C